MKQNRRRHSLGRPCMSFRRHTLGSTDLFCFVVIITSAVRTDAIRFLIPVVAFVPLIYYKDDGTHQRRENTEGCD